MKTQLLDDASTFLARVFQTRRVTLRQENANVTSVPDYRYPPIPEEREGIGLSVSNLLIMLVLELVRGF